MNLLTKISCHFPVLCHSDLAESFLDSWLEELGSWLRQQVFTTFEQLAESDAAFFEPKPKLRDLDVDQTCAALLEQIQRK